MLEKNQINDILEKREQREQIVTAHQNEQRVRLHSNADLSANGIKWASNEFLKFIEKELPKDKFSAFKRLYRFPLDTNPVTNDTYQFYEKVFDGCDPVRKYTFVDEDLEVDRLEFFDSIGFPSKYQLRSMEELKARYNSIVVIDLPNEQKGSKPEPYYYFLQIQNVLHIDQSNGKIDFIVFEQENELIVIDGESYQKFDFTDKELGAELANESHDIGYCPAKYFVDEAIDSLYPIVKKHPFSLLVSQLDDMLAYMISKKSSDWVNAWQIYWQYVDDCDFKRESRDEDFVECKGGFLADEQGAYRYRGDALEPCPICEKKLVGAGSIIDVKMPEGKDDFNPTPPAGIIETNVDNLRYNVEEVQRLVSAFKRITTGNSIDPINNAAINEKQVMSLLDGGNTVLNSIKRIFETTEQWIGQTICRLRYGDSFISSSVSYGSEFYLLNADTLLKLSNEFTGNPIISGILEDKYFETKYKNNPDQRMRIKIINNLDPFRHIENEVVLQMLKDQMIEREQMLLKINLPKYILQFERNNGSLVAFASDNENIGFDRKIELIEQEIKSYIEIKTPDKITIND